MKKGFRIVMVVFFLTSIIVGCQTTSQGSKTYTRGQAQTALATRPALEIEVKLDDGRLMVVVQEKDDEFAVGDRVRLLQSPDGKMRIRQ